MNETTNQMAFFILALLGLISFGFSDDRPAIVLPGTQPGVAQTFDPYNSGAMTCLTGHRAGVIRIKGL